MRTTLDLPDHLLTEIKIRAAKEHRKIKDVITEALEKGLSHKPDNSKKRKEIEVKPIFNSAFPKSLDNVNFNHLADTIALEEQLDKL